MTMPLSCVWTGTADHPGSGRAAVAQASNAPHPEPDRSHEHRAPIRQPTSSRSGARSAARPPAVRQPPRDAPARSPAGRGARSPGARRTGRVAHRAGAGRSTRDREEVAGGLRVEMRSAVPCARTTGHRTCRGRWGRRPGCPRTACASPKTLGRKRHGRPSPLGLTRHRGRFRRRGRRFRNRRRKRAPGPQSSNATARALHSHGRAPAGRRRVESVPVRVPHGRARESDHGGPRLLLQRDHVLRTPTRIPAPA